MSALVRSSHRRYMCSWPDQALKADVPLSYRGNGLEYVAS